MSFNFTSFDKAIAAAVLAAAGVLATAAQGGSVTEQDYIGAAITAIVSGLAVYLKGNLPASTASKTP